MVNHMRTVLFNVSARQAPDAVYISPYFRPVEVPRELLRIYDVLLSPQAVDSVRSERMNTFMRLLHVADYEPFTLMPDSRITYDPTSQGEFFSTTVDSSSEIDYDRLLNLARSAVNTLDAQNLSLFRPVSGYPQYPNLMNALRDIWNNDLVAIGRLTAAILALGYRFDDLNRG
jgi:hypothetical protein